MKYLMRSVKRASEAVRNWTEDNCDANRVNSLFTMVFGRFSFKGNKRFDPLSWSLGCQVFLHKEGNNIGELNEEQEQA